MKARIKNMAYSENPTERNAVFKNHKLQLELVKTPKNTNSNENVVVAPDLDFEKIDIFIEKNVKRATISGLLFMSTGIILTTLSKIAIDHFDS